MFDKAVIMNDNRPFIIAKDEHEMLCYLVVVVFDGTKRYIGCVYDDIE